MAVIVNIQLYKSEDKIYEDTIYESDGTTPQDITGWALLFSFHKYGDPDTVFFEKTTGDGIEITNADEGVCQVTVESDDTEDLYPNQYGYYISRTDTGDNAVLTSGLATLALR